MLSLPQELREQCAKHLLASVERASQLTAFVGLDGFVDEIIHLVDVRSNAAEFDRIPTIARLAERLAGAAGQSTNIEAVTQRVKLGGNGPIMANALCRFGVKVTYVGALGYPTLHPVFADFAASADVHSIAPPGLTDAYEFQDGKVMIGKTVQLGEITWENIQLRVGRKWFADRFFSSDLVAFVNWTMIPFMSDIWEAVQHDLCPASKVKRRKIFFDLADPEKRTHEDIRRALKLIAGFRDYFEVLLGLNETEAKELGLVLGLGEDTSSRAALSGLARDIRQATGVDTLVVHPVTYAVAVSDRDCEIVDGPFIASPLITTGAGDHFNAGFCLGKCLGLDDEMSLLAGVTTSGFYVRNAQSPRLTDLADMLRHWPSKES
jgi:sugar/nucleoside kinase (ribokinase family)